MATENTETNGDTGPSSESNEHDYAHTADANFASSGTPTEPEQSAPVQPSASLPVEHPEPAVGAEVDCPGGNDAEPQKTVLAPPAVGRGPSRRPRRPEDRNCSCCKLQFERQGRSFNRRAVYTFTTPDTVHWAFPGSVVHEKSFLCETCAQVVRSKCKRKQSGKRSLWLKPAVTKQSQVKDKKMSGRRMGKKSKAALLVSKSSYKAAFHMLWSAKGARKPMMDFWSKMLKEEMKTLSRHSDSPFHQKVSGRKPLSSFPWRRCLNWAQDKAPLVTTCLRSLFPDINALFKSNHQLTEEQAFTLLERRTVVALSIPLFTRNIWKNNFMQAALGAELRLQGCSGSALDTLNTMGLCQNKDTVRLLLHRLRNGKDASTQDGEAMTIKQEQLKEQMGEAMTDVEEDEDDEEEDKDEDDEEDEEEEEEEEEMVMAVEEEVEEEEVQEGVQDEDEEEEEEEKEKKRRRKKAKKQRKEEKRKERGKRKAKERVEEEEEEEEEGPEGQKKRRVVVVRLGLLKGHSEVGRSDLSAP
ncbi:uncharacterized protein LOC111582587 [Amphiprion ocellaris]|uniref:uncharacterized protein LOC111582587 n=1 Tax=Amphiprion ocellaris TaxID=80972 RepID=UPI0024114AB2|nr:uncharacterized protein LOC111582587 [Amphiprion ocellaris]